MAITALRVLAWLLLGTVVFVTVGPIGLRPMTGYPAHAERALAFFLVGLVFTMAYPRHMAWVLAFVVLSVICLELLQNLRPGRHGREIDAAVKIAGLMLGASFGFWRR